MKRKIHLCFFVVTIIIVLSPVEVSAQLTPEQRIQDSVIGWWSKLSDADKPKPYQFRGRTFSTKQQEYMNTVIRWMQKSYTPVGGTGTFKKMIYVEQESYASHAYGVDFRVWNVSFDKMWLDAQGHFTPISEEYTRFGITANTIIGSFPIYFINTPAQYLFTWQPDGYALTEQAQKRQHNGDQRIHPNVYKYLTWINDAHTVYLAPGNQLPIVAVTKGELLQLAEEAVDRQLQSEKKEVESKWPGNIKAQQDAYEYRKKNIEKYRGKIQQLREKHKGSLHEPAVIRNMQPTIYSFETDPDPFVITQGDKNLKHYYPVYKIEPSVMEKCKTDQPQWIAVSFPYKTKEDGNQLYELYKALTENFNYDYAFDYFFNPEKVKGIAYKPANEEQLTARLAVYRKKTAVADHAKVNNVPLPPNVYFMDDFSANTEGGSPSNWYFRKYGKHSFITSVKDEKGKWLQMGYNNPVSPSLLKKPLPENFTLEYDIVTDGEFSSGTGGAASLILNTRPSNADGSETEYNNGTRVNIHIASGNEADFNNTNYRGLLKIAINSTPSENKQNFAEGIYYEYPLREFTGRKTKIHVAVKIKGGTVSVFVNNRQVAFSKDFKMTYGGACISCGLPAGTRFNSIYWKNTTNDADTVKVYIGNIKITKE